MSDLIYLAQAIDLSDGADLSDDVLGVVSRASEKLQLPVFDPRQAWSRSILETREAAAAGRESLVSLNQAMALSSKLLIAAFDLSVPSWGMPFEVLERRKGNKAKATLLVTGTHPDRWPMYLRWVLDGNAAWVPIGPRWINDGFASVDRALAKLGLVE